MPDRPQLLQAQQERIVQRGGGVVEEHHALELLRRRSLLEDLGELLAVFDDCDSRLAVIDDVRDLAGRAGRVHGNCDRSRAQDAEIREVPVRAIRRQERDSISRRDADVDQPGRNLTNGVSVLGPRHLLPDAVDRLAQRGVCCEPYDLLTEQLDDRGTRKGTSGIRLEA